MKPSLKHHILSFTLMLIFAVEQVLGFLIVLHNDIKYQCALEN